MLTRAAEPSAFLSGTVVSFDHVAMTAVVSLPAGGTAELPVIGITPLVVDQVVTICRQVGTAPVCIGGHRP
jgi:hypothetical protein